MEARVAARERRLAEVETDAVFAAYSHDNLDLSTSYRLHSIALDHQLNKAIGVNLTCYRYLLRDLAQANTLETHWRNRLRANLVATC